MLLEFQMRLFHQENFYDAVICKHHADCTNLEEKQVLLLQELQYFVSAIVLGGSPVFLGSPNLHCRGAAGIKRAVVSVVASSRAHADQPWRLYTARTSWAPTASARGGGKSSGAEPASPTRCRCRAA